MISCSNKLKPIILILFGGWLSLSAAAQQEDQICTEVSLIKRHLTKRYVKLSVCVNDTLLEEVETYLKAEYKFLIFKQKRYRMNRHGLSKKFESNGDYQSVVFDHGVAVEKRYYLNDGTEVSQSIYEVSHPQIYFLNGTREYFEDGVIKLLIEI